MDDLFEREQGILEEATLHMEELLQGAPYDVEKYVLLVKEYGRLLKQLRRITKLSDRTAVNLNASKLDLLDKVHYDSLTGIDNRRFLEDNLQRLIAGISRSGGGWLSVLMIDIDFFKKYNDTYGHQKGDECLRVVAKSLDESASRADGFVARYGGEEFIVVLPNTRESGAYCYNIHWCDNWIRGAYTNRRKLCESGGSGALSFQTKWSEPVYIDYF